MAKVTSNWFEPRTLNTDTWSLRLHSGQNLVFDKCCSCMVVLDPNGKDELVCVFFEIFLHTHARQ